MGKFTNIEAADQDLNRSVLIEQWRREYSCSPPKYLSLRLIHATLAWDAQANATGRIPAKTLRALKSAGKAQNSLSTTNLKAGVTLVREWNAVPIKSTFWKTAFVWMARITHPSQRLQKR